MTDKTTKEINKYNEKIHIKMEINKTLNTIVKESGNIGSILNMRARMLVGHIKKLMKKLEE